MTTLSFTQDRCVACGRLTRLHFDDEQRKLSCEETGRRHPRASVKIRTLTELWTAALQGE